MHVCRVWQDLSAGLTFLKLRLTTASVLPCAMQVRFAKEKQYVVPSTGPKGNRQLFFARAPPGVAEHTMRSIFQAYGEVEAVKVFLNHETGSSKGCGFVTMADRTAAEAALDALHGKYIVEASYVPYSCVEKSHCRG